MTTAKTLQITLNGVETDSIPVVDGMLADGAYGLSDQMGAGAAFDCAFHQICESLKVTGLNVSGVWWGGTTRVEWTLKDSLQAPWKNRFRTQPLP